jgi:hypothetical protein
MFGDNDNSPADTVQGAGATSTVIPVTSGAAWQPGNAMGVVIGGVVYIREVKSISSNDVTLKYALPSAPAAASVIIGCQTWFPGVGSNDGSTSKTLQVIVNTKVGDQQFCLVGGHITGVTLDTPIGGLPTISSEWTFADIFQISDTLADATYSYNHLVAMDSEFRCATTATTTVSQVHANSATFKLNLTWQKQKTFGGVNTVSGYTRVQKAPVIEGEFTIPSEDDSWDDHADNRDDMMISLQIGESPTFGCLQLVAPTVQITETDLDPIDGIEGQKIPWKGRRDENTTGGSDAYLNTAAFRIHFARTLAA